MRDHLVRLDHFIKNITERKNEVSRGRGKTQDQLQRVDKSKGKCVVVKRVTGKSFQQKIGGIYTDQSNALKYKVFHEFAY